MGTICVELFTPRIFNEFCKMIFQNDWNANLYTTKMIRYTHDKPVRPIRFKMKIFIYKKNLKSKVEKNKNEIRLNIIS